MLYEIYHYTKELRYSGNYEPREKTLYIVNDTDENVRAFVDKLNDLNNSYYIQDPADKEENYISFREKRFESVEEIMKHNILSSRVIEVRR